MANIRRFYIYTRPYLKKVLLAVYHFKNEVFNLIKGCF